MAGRLDEIYAADLTYLKFQDAKLASQGLDM